MPGIQADLPQVPGQSQTDPLADAKDILLDLGIPEEAIEQKKRALKVDLSMSPELETDAETFLQALQDAGAKGIMFPDRDVLMVMVSSAANPYQGPAAGAGGGDAKALVRNRWPAIYRHLDRLRSNGVRMSKAETLQSIEQRFPELGPEGAKEAYYQFYFVHQSKSLKQSMAVMQAQIIKSEDETTDASSDPQEAASDPEISLS